jgi:hypothetical protein
MVLVLLAGCGPSTTIGMTGLSIVVTSSSVTNDLAGAVRTGPVTLHTNAKVYGIKDTIFVTVSNQSNRTIYFPDHLTNCTVILLQRQPIQLPVSRGMQPVNLCRLKIVTRLHALGARQSLIVRLVAPFHGWPPGAYRAVLSYRKSISAGVTTTISTGFRVGPFVQEGL